MKYAVYVTYKYPTYNNCYRGIYCSSTKLGAYIKAFWNTKFNWQYFNYVME